MSDRKGRRAPNSLIASAKILTTERINAPRSEQWMDEAWGYYDSTGELRFAARWFSNALSRCRLMAATKPRGPGDEPAPLASGPAVDVLAELAGGPIGQGQLLAAMALHLTVPGIGYLVGETSDQGATTWDALSADVLRLQGDRFERQEELQSWRPLADDHLVVKVWRAHPRYPWVPDSPTRGVLNVLRELTLLTQHVDASATSRLAGAGLFLVPSEVMLPVRPDKPDEDPLMLDLMEAAQTAIKDRSSASAYLPVILKVPGEHVEHFRHITFATPFDEQSIALREEAIKRFAAGMDCPAEVVLGLADSNHWCVDEETEALTHNGWRHVDELAVGDEVYALDHETGLAGWSRIDDLYVAAVADEPMVAIETPRRHSSLTTQAHRWPVQRPQGRRWATSTTLREYDRITTAAQSADLPAEAKWTDDLVELAAWYWTEGNVGPAVSIAQSHTANPQRVERIRACLTRLFGPALPTLRGSTAAGWREAVQQNATSHGGPITVFHLNAVAAEPLHDIAPGKTVRESWVTDLTRAQLELFIDVSLQGDGQHYRSGRLDIFQRDPRALDALEVAGILAGYTVSRCEQPGGWRLNISRRTTVRPVKAHRAAVRDGRGEQITTLAYTGRVWCPVTQKSTWLARRRGSVWYTGNTAWQIEDSAIKLHIEPMLEAVCHALTMGYLHPTLETRAAPNDDVMIWYDTSELNVPPDQSSSAVLLYDRLEIGGAALRRETGFGEDDAPTRVELERSVLLKIVAGAPSLAPIILPALGIVVDLPAVPLDEITEPPPEGEGAPAGPPPTREDTPPGPGLTPGEAALVAAADGLVFRALERAGNRLRTRMNGRHAAPSPELAASPAHLAHTCLGEQVTTLAPLPDLLAGAWERVPEVAERYGVDTDALRESLDAYTSALLATGEEHCLDRLVAHLAGEP